MRELFFVSYIIYRILEVNFCVINDRIVSLIYRYIFSINLCCLLMVVVVVVVGG